MKLSDKERALLAVEALEKAYPDAVCSLRSGSPLELLIATRLAAQCTDARVNLVTPALFRRFPTAEDFADGSVEEIEELIKSCGLYKTKARDIFEMCQKLVADFGGEVPGTMEELLSLPGIGRKTANLVLGDVFGQPAVVADTHCIRITNKLGLTTTKDPYKVEMQLRKVLPMEKANDFCHRLVLHGRAVCDARKPKCEDCCMNTFCINFQSRKESEA